MIYIDNKRKKQKTLISKYPNAKIVDVTSKSTTALIKLSPFFPHGDIPIPFSNGLTAKSVEGIWQGLKVFEKTDIDIDMFYNDKMKNIKRTIRKYGRPLGHRKGVYGVELLNYIDARIQIYLPSYLWVLENKVIDIIKRLRDASIKEDIVLLDFETNCDVFNTKKPLSHAFLVKAYAENNYPNHEQLYKQFFEKNNNPDSENKIINKSESEKGTNTQTSLF